MTFLFLCRKQSKVNSRKQVSKRERQKRENVLYIHTDNASPKPQKNNHTHETKRDSVELITLIMQSVRGTQINYIWWANNIVQSKEDRIDELTCLPFLQTYLMQCWNLLQPQPLLLVQMDDWSLQPNHRLLAKARMIVP